ncbi:MAG: phytanoyl-CoA dioxygenase [Planctomyces sp.]|nr:phytanoyl-CoA dioxygenase [Planctomyces sp.]
MSRFEPYRTAFESDGFVVVPQFYSPEEVATLKGEIDRYINEVLPKGEAGQAFYQDPNDPTTLKQINNFENDAWFAEMPLRERWKELAETLLGEEAHSKTPEWFNKPPEMNHPTPPHQDNYYFSLTPPQVLTMWLALDDVDEENGCLRYVPGSHREPIRAHGRTKVLGFSQGIDDYSESDFAREVAIHMQPGDVAIHHGDTIHRADANRSADRHRRSLALVFRGVSCQRDEVAFARYQETMKQQHEELGYK